MNKKDKIRNAIKLRQALKTKQEAYVLLEAIDRVEDRVNNIKPADLTDIEDKINYLKGKINEDIEIQVEIV